MKYMYIIHLNKNKFIRTIVENYIAKSVGNNKNISNYTFQLESRNN